MQENARYAVGIDIGTTVIRCVVGHIDSTTGAPSVVGVGQAPNTGMRKGVVANLQGPAAAIDAALGEAERMSGYQVDYATVSINGSHILSVKADGMIAVGAMDHEVTHEDLMRIEDVATVGKVPANREILEVVPHSYRLDGQDNIKDPLGMTGTRLEIRANVVSALAPHLHNLQKTAEMAKVDAHTIVPSVLAAAKAVLKEQQIENGVAVIDMGASTTSVAVFEEGDLQYVGVVPVGGANITNDLAIGLKADPEIAEKVKLSHASATGRKNNEGISVKEGEDIYTFSTSDIDEIVEARLEEIFEAVENELKKAGRAGQLPSGVVLTGGTANLANIVEFARTKLGLAARVGQVHGLGGAIENIEQPEYAAACGLMLIDSESALGNSGKKSTRERKNNGKNAKQSFKKASNGARKFLGKFKV
ncbi:MAG TPA: cell division protein FtsA [Candidatus Saccharibacteria bacterium]|nr:cell division protein FtsA [Candidatus Saccharibacteria bacterium]HRK94300.1 cell division protein FtsA [Candidatus Saccharibacteria bacterium]